MPRRLTVATAEAPVTDTHPYASAVDNFDNRIPPEDREDFVAGRPHEDAYFDWLWVSRNGGDLSDGWRFAYACEHYPDDCHDAVGDMPIRRGPDGHPAECPDCGSKVFRLARAWDVPMRKPALASRPVSDTPDRAEGTR